MAQAFFGGVHPNDMKAATNEKAIEQLEAPAEVVIPMSMHIGAPCKPIVAVGDKVTIGQKIGEPGGFVSAPIHASVSGTVKAVEPRPFSMGGTMMSVVIENDFQNTVCPDIHPVDDPDSLTPEQLVEIVKNAGIVGQGGATFPTHVKISSGLGKVDYVIINAAECEPYITGDHRTMLERPEQVIKGATLLAKCFGVEHVYIGVEANKQNAADVLNKTIDGKLCEPIERMIADVPENSVGSVIDKISQRKGDLVSMTPIGSRMRLEFLVPTRGLFGYRNEFLTDTRGEGIMASTLDSYAPVKGEISRRLTGSLVAFETGETTAYGIGGVQDRGSMFIGPGVEVYAGMIVGQCNRNEDMAVNVCKKKQLTNMRAAGSDAAIRLVPPTVLSLEQCMEYLADDELLEVTPKSLRMRKRQLDHSARMRALMKSRQ